MNYRQRVANTLRPLGREQHELAAMILEWRYTDTCYDKEQAIHTCELCSKHNLRYHFEIENQHTQETLLVGSECILSFLEWVAKKSGKPLNKKAVKKKLNRDRTLARNIAAKQRVYTLLLGLSLADYSIDLEPLTIEYGQRGAFSPRQLLGVISDFNRLSQTADTSVFKMIIKREREKEELLGLSKVEALQIWHCMSKSQRDKYIEENGYPNQSQESPAPLAVLNTVLPTPPQLWLADIGI